MAKKLFGLTAEDLKYQKQINARVQAGYKSEKPQRRRGRRPTPGGGATNAGWGKVVAHRDSTGITAADPTTSPPTVGWGYINPCSCPSLPDDIDAEPDHDPLPGDLQYATDEETFLVVYNIAPSEVLHGEVVDRYVQWKTLGPSGHRFIDFESCVEV